MLRYLDEVARCGSIRKAAARLNVAASSINRQIIALEEEAGMPLFERLPNRLRMTAAGETVLAHIRRTLSDFERTQSYLEDLRGARRGEVTVAMMGGLGSDLMARAAVAFRDRRPHVKLIFHRFNMAEIVTAVREGRADLGLGFSADEPRGLRSLLVVECPVGAVMSPRHPLAQRTALRLTELLTQRLIMPSSNMSLRHVVDALFSRGGIRVDTLVEANEVELMKRLAVLEHGITLLNRMNIEPERQRGELVFVPIQERNPPVQTLRLLELSRPSTSTLPAIFAETLERLVRETYPS
ncbi:LysR family transcriptional regulator [Roseomonas gilardii]|uniref:LysR family transcriptional regulator n=1 Tax=Roseomonas gilardii TaxID=257708 RepID=UPI0004B2852B|nr:LysR family transcriptional regulator [Roseomonas gilardii]